ncbi:MAG: hypothetical protein MI802_06340 [Desulfobacterales bacterium]|nr:hypothetical protein [Desulfobacterales bacterium]
MTADTLLKKTFIAGAIIDTAIAISWLLVSFGWDLPNIVNGFTSPDEDYKFQLFVNALFMAGWGSVLYWGAQNPVERRGLLPLTSAWLTLSIFLELLLFGDLLEGPWLVFGIIKRLLISISFIWVYAWSKRKQPGAA